MPAEIARPPATPISWHVWLKANPRVFVEVTEQLWLDARVKGACAISALTGEPVFFESLEAAPSDSNLVHLEVERMRRAMLASPPSIR